MNSTIDYYNNNSKIYYELTKSSDLGKVYDIFLENVEKGHILDIGCGSGRDSLEFIKRGYKVTAIDGSIKMAEIASKHIGQDVLLMDIENITLSDKFQGVWACASLLHIEKSNMEIVLDNIASFIEKGGAFYMSFKNKNIEYIDEDGRYFNCYDEYGIKEIINKIPTLEISNIFITDGAKKGDEKEKWLNIICKKI